MKAKVCIIISRIKHASKYAVGLYSERKFFYERNIIFEFLALLWQNSFTKLI